MVKRPLFLAGVCCTMVLACILAAGAEKHLLPAERLPEWALCEDGQEAVWIGRIAECGLTEQGMRLCLDRIHSVTDPEAGIVKDTGPAVIQKEDTQGIVKNQKYYFYDISSGNWECNCGFLPSEYQKSSFGFISSKPQKNNFSIISSETQESNFKLILEHQKNNFSTMSSEFQTDYFNMIRSGDQEADSYQMLVYTDERIYEPGDWIMVRGKCRTFSRATNPGQFDAYRYYTAQKILLSLRDTEILAYYRGKNSWEKWLHRIKYRIYTSYEGIFGEEEAAAMAAISLGEKSLLEEKQKQLYQEGGISHIFAISGLHISLLGIGLYRLLRKCYIPAGVSAAAAGSVLVSYVAMVGWSASSKRACIMFLIWLGAQVTGRTYDRLTALAAAAIMILCSDPLLLKEAAFQMSFLSILSLAVLAPVLCSALRIRTGTGQALAGGTALQMGMLPCTLYFYYQTQPWSILVNLAVVPLMTFIMGFGMAGGVLGILWKPAGIFLAAPCHYLLAGIERLCRMEQELPGALLVCGRPETGRIAWYYLMIFGTLLLLDKMWKLRETNRKVKYPAASCRASGLQRSKAGEYLDLAAGLRSASVGAKRMPPAHSTAKYPCRYGCLARCFAGIKQKMNRSSRQGKVLYQARGRRILKCGCVLAWVCVSIAGSKMMCAKSPDSLEVICLDVGQGDGILVRTPSGENCMIDGGSTSEQKIWTYRIGRTMKFEGIREIDWWFVSHTDHDHISGLLEFLEEYEVNLFGENQHGITLHHLVLPYSSIEDEKMAELRRIAGEKEIAVHMMQRGDCVAEDEKNAGSAGLLCRMHCLAPEPASLTGDKNEDSLVLLLQYGKFRMLLTGDLEGRGEQNLLDSGISLDADVLKVGHHGSKNASSETFLKEVHPENAVISYGKGNQYGHPSAEILERLEDAGSLVYGTAESGALTVSTDGYRYSIGEYLKQG